MVNKYVWDLYVKSGGREIISFFKENILDGISETYPEEIYRLQKEYCVTKSILNGTKEQLELLRPVIRELNSTEDNEPIEDLSDTEELGDIEEFIESALSETYESWLEELKTEKAIFSGFTSQIAYYSTFLAWLYPGVFIPYYFFSNYNVLTKIADAFEIELPEIPKKAAYEDRVWHYADLCKSFYRFRKANGLSVYELCAFLYDFAPNYIGGCDSYIINDLPCPKAAYFVGGGGDNLDAVAEDNPDEIEFWQCNPETRAGDMIVMYLRTPISSISSIWRSMSVGFIDPFFYYYRCTYIGRPEKLPRISIHDIKKDPILGKMPIVSKNMQGINGVELKPSEYNYIVEQADVNVPTLEYEAPDHSMPFANEKEVEEKLIKPLLKELGYSENDYVQQMYIEIGNHNHALIPDFVLNPTSMGGHYSGYAVLEAKRSIKNAKQLEETKTQVRSYAKLLSAKYAVIASSEKIWVTSSVDDYTENAFEATWNSLHDADTMYSLKKRIGSERERQHLAF